MGRSFGDGRQVRDVLWVDDLLDAYESAIDRIDTVRGRVYNLGSDEVVDLRELGELLVELNGGGEVELVPFPPDRKAIDIGDFYADFSRIRTELGWEPLVPLRAGLERALDYYRAHGEAYW